MSKTMNNNSNIRKHQPLCSKLIKKKQNFLKVEKIKKEKKKDPNEIKKASNFVTK